jgi:queuine tRNA-ribosyltransferase
MSFFSTITTAADCKARAGILKTDHGIIETPIFMPVGTQGAVKAIEHRELDELGVQIILGNTYHLYLRPGNDVLSSFGGLHQFNSWNKPLLTDSGGYQVFSLKDLRKITEKGVEFRSHLDGSKHIFTPENVIETQRIIGSDIMMPLDECTPYPATYDYAKKSADMTVRWAKRNKEAFDNSSPRYGHTQFLFGIGQGSIYPDLRRACMSDLVEMNFDGYSIGGLAVGESAENMYEMTDISTDCIPQNKPRYLMGVGTPENILNAIELGVDMFDCVMPTRNARNGMLFTANGTINIKNKKWEADFSPLDEMGITFVDTEYTKAYLRHLFASNEYLGKQIATIHNLGFYMWLVREARKHILAGDFRVWKEMMVKQMSQRL